MTARDHALPFKGQLYRIIPEFDAVLEIESEIGSVAALYARLTGGAWTVGEVVSCAHILLNRARCPCDYMQLGNEMIAAGFERYRATLARVLMEVIDQEGVRDAQAG